MATVLIFTVLSPLHCFIIVCKLIFVFLICFKYRKFHLNLGRRFACSEGCQETARFLSIHRSKAVILVSFLVIFCVVIYLNVSFRNELPRMGKRELIFLLSITRNHVVSVRRGFFFPLGA